MCRSFAKPPRRAIHATSALFSKSIVFILKTYPHHKKAIAFGILFYIITMGILGNCNLNLNRFRALINKNNAIEIMTKVNANNKLHQLLTQILEKSLMNMSDEIVDTILLHEYLNHVNCIKSGVSPQNSSEEIAKEIDQMLSLHYELMVDKIQKIRSFDN